MTKDTLSYTIEKKLIFTVTTGRSGTGYLATMLNFVPGVVSYHEPEPTFSDVMRAIQQDDNIAFKFWLEQKLPQIVNERAAIYIETSHLFCKGFFEPLLKLGITPDLIILSRHNRKVATSMCQLRTIPGRTEKGLKYLLSPEDPGVLPLPDWQKLNDYQLCYWYCLEIERRSKKYERILLKRNAKVARVSIDEINTIYGFNKLLKQLNLPGMGAFNWLRFLLNKKSPVNTKIDRKTLITTPENIDFQEQEVMELIKNMNPEGKSIH